MKKEIEKEATEITSDRSEEVQAIIDRMPTYWVKWVVLCVGILMCIVLSLGFIIQYPDTVDGQITLNATTAPVKLVSATTGQLHLTKSNASSIHQGEVLGYIENSANFKHMLLLDSLLNGFSMDKPTEMILPDTMHLGEMNAPYSAFLQSLSNYAEVTSQPSNKSLIQRIKLDVKLKKNALQDVLSQWKSKYVITSPIDGEIEFMGFWKENSFVRAGEELFTIIPKNGKIYGEAIIPSMGAGKVKVGQEVNIKIDKYPYDEYGLVRGQVKSVSRLTCKVQTQNGFMETYQIVVDFPHGLTTNFGQELPFDFETKGIAEIITKRKNLMERMFDNLKAKSVK